MEKLEFRKLKPEDIDIRVSTVNEKGATFLLYKDARVDMEILDETVGPLYWKKEYTRDNRNCKVSIYNKELGEWISKEDTGTESFSEAEKGLASDSFKRACFNWGIGRELYSSPFIWISAKDLEIVKNNKGKVNVNTKLEVKLIDYDGSGKINKLEIIDSKTKKLLFAHGTNSKVDNTIKTEPKAKVENADVEVKKDPKIIYQTRYAELLKILLGDVNKFNSIIKLNFDVNTQQDLVKIILNDYENVKKIVEKNA